MVDRQSLLETFKEEGIGAGLEQTASMLMPQTGRPGTGIGDLFSDFVNFSPIGDLLDIKEGLDFSNDLDPLERGMSLLPLVGGATGIAWATGRHLQKTGANYYRAMKSQVAPAQAMTPPVGEPIPSMFNEPDPFDSSIEEPAQRQRMVAGFDQARLSKIVPSRQAIQEAGRFDELAVALGISDPEPAVFAAEQLQAAGRLIVARSTDGRYTTPDSDGQIAPPEVQELAAAQNAALRWRTAEQKYEWPQLELILGDTDGKGLQQLVEFELAAARWHVGPDLSPWPGYTLVPGIDAEGTVHVGLGVDVLPDMVLFDPETGLSDNNAIRARLAQIDPNTLVGHMAANLATAIQRPGGTSGVTWYPRANATIRSIASQPEIRAMGFDDHLVSAVLAAGSPRTSWANNLVGGLHMILQKAGVEPGRYRQIFKDAVKAGGWEEDIWAWAGAKRKKAAGTPDVLLDEVSNPEFSGNKYHLGDNVVRAEKVFAGMPIEDVLHTLKVGNFDLALWDPDLVDPVAIDVHHTATLIGLGTFDYFPGSKGESKVYKGYYGAGINADALIREHAPEIFGTNNQVQAGPWPNQSEWKRRLNNALNVARRIEEKTGSVPVKLRERIAELLQEGIYSTQLVDTISGYGSVSPTVMSYLNQASPDLNVTVPDLSRVKSPIHLVDGVAGVEVYADVSQPGVWEATRHLVPTEFGVPGTNYVRMVPRSPQRVDSVRDHLKHIGSQVAEDGLPMYGEARIYVGGKPPSSVRNGNWFEFDGVDMTELQRAFDEAGIPATAMEVVQHERQTLSRGRRSDVRLEDYGDELNSELGPIGTQHWQAVSAFLGDRDLSTNRAANRAARRRLERLGGKVIDAVGNWRKEPQPELRTPERERVNSAVAGVAERYMRKAGLPYEPAQLATEIDEGRAMRIADDYLAMPELDEASFASYEAFKAETLAQYEALVEDGYTIEPSVEDPYGAEAPSREMFKDVRENKRIRFFLTDLDSMPEGHPMAEQSGVVINGQALTFNDLFRAIHDVFGHARNSNQFGPLGEENAWRTHMAMFSEKARPAMTAETRGQNSVVNYGPAMRNKEGRIIRQGEEGYIPPRDRPFADQKAALLPEDYAVVDTADRAVMESEESFLVFGLPDEVVARVMFEEFGQQGVATPNGMLSSDGSYNPVTRIVYGEQAINSESGHTVATLPDGRKLAFSTEINWEESLDTPADNQLMAEPTSDKGSTVVVKVGDAVSTMTPAQVRKIHEIGSKKARATRAYLHGQAWVTPDMVPVYEHSFTDAAGQTMTYVTAENVGMEQANQGVAYVPRAEQYRYSKGGNEVLSKRRKVREARRISEFTDDNRVFVDGDVEVRYNPNATVTRTAEGSLLGFKIDGRVASVASIDMTGGTPVIRVGEGAGGMRGGFVTAQLSRGRVVGLTAFDLNDVSGAVDVLGRAGAIVPEDIDVRISGERQAGGLEALPEPFNYKPNARYTETHSSWQMTPPDQPNMPDGVEIEVTEGLALRADGRRVKAKVQFGGWGQRSRAKARSLGQELFGYFPHQGQKPTSASARFSEIYGELPVEMVDEAKVGFTVVDTGHAGPGGMAHYQGDVVETLGIQWDDGLLLADEQHGGRMLERLADGVMIPGINKMGVKYESYVAAHEFGHFVEGVLRRYGYGHKMSRIQEDLKVSMDSLGIEMGAYSQSKLSERWGEAWAWAVLDPEGAPLPVRQAVRQVVSLLNSVYTGPGMSPLDRI